MHAIAWSRRLEVTGGGTGVVAHAGLVLLRMLADRTGLTGGLSEALASDRLLAHDRGRVLADLACAMADGAEVISDFRVMGDQAGLFGPVASVPTAWRTLCEIADGGEKTARGVTAAVNAARRPAWAAIAARHGRLPGVRVAGKVLDGVTCIRLDATVITAHSDKSRKERSRTSRGSEKGIIRCWPTATTPASRWPGSCGRARPHSAGPDTAADHVKIVDNAIAALPPCYRRRLMVTCDGAWASHDLVAHLDKLASRRGFALTWSVDWELGERERQAISIVAGQTWHIAVDGKGEVRERRSDEACGDRECAHRKCWTEEAHVTELTGILCGGLEDQLAGWPASMRVFARRERPHPGAQLTLFEAEDGWRYTRRRRLLNIATTWPWAAAIITTWDRISALPQAP